MKVLFIQQGFGYGGATKSLLETQKALKDHVELYTITKKNKRLNNVLSKEFKYSNKIVELDIPGIYSYSEGISSTNEFKIAKEYDPNEIINYINKNEINIVHVNSSVFSNLLKGIKENTKSKIVVHFREVLKNNGTNEIEKYIIENTYKYADAIIGISPIEIGCFNNSNKIYVIPNPHDFSQTDSFLLYNKKDLNKIIVGMCANFNPVKGHLIFLEAIDIINKNNLLKNYNLEFRIIGYPNHSVYNFIKRYFIKSSYLHQFHKVLNSKKISNLRLIPFTLDVYKELSNLNIYVRPDISGNPWGRDIIEAMALKLPIIATGENEFYIKNNKCGLLIKPDDKIALAEKIQELIINKELQKTFGENAYSKIKKLCEVSTYRKSILDIYKNIFLN
jgi:glycosyltransferase involved in cell wall biosynthesis